MSIIKLNSAQCKRSFKLTISKSGAKIRKIIELRKSMEIFCKKYRMASDLTDDDHKHNHGVKLRKCQKKRPNACICVIFVVSSARPFPSFTPYTQGGFSAAALCRLLGILPPNVRLFSVGLVSPTAFPFEAKIQLASSPADHMQASRILLPSSALPPYDY